MKPQSPLAGKPADIATVQTLRSDVALQLARHVRRSAQTQLSAAQRLGIPQPTLSKIMRGRVSDLSLELLLRVAVRAGLPIVLQTGRDAAEAGAYVSGVERGEAGRSRSGIAEQARQAVSDAGRRLTPEQRLEAHVRHSELLTALHRAGAAARKGRGR
jgi:predicted XRE-type DNA-binding protein